MAVTPEESVDFAELAEGTRPRSWSATGPLDGPQRVMVQAWIDVTGALADGCPDPIGDPDFCLPRAGDPVGEEVRDVAPIDFVTWEITIVDPDAAE